jgi:hypothetical protein
MSIVREKQKKIDTCPDFILVKSRLGAEVVRQ